MSENENNVQMAMFDVSAEQKTEPKKKKSKAKKVFKSIFFIILFLILLPFMLIFYTIRFFVERAKKRKWEREGKRGKMLLLSSTITDIDIMEGYEFEEYLKTLFFYDGYKTETTQKAKDYGADIIMEKDDEKIVVQAKRYKKIVGIKSVQEVIGAMKHYNATSAMVVTNARFSSEAELLAKENCVRLVDRDELIEIQTRVKEELKITTKESELVDKKNLDIKKNFHI